MDRPAVAEAKERVIDYLEQIGRGRRATTYRLRNWLFSRQRYWGSRSRSATTSTTCRSALPDHLLPLLLPETNDFSRRPIHPTTRTPCRSRRWAG